MEGSKTGKVNQEKKKESKTAWKETRRGGKISTRSESKRLEIRVHGKEK